MANYTRFSPSDWSASNIDHYNSADASRCLFDLLFIIVQLLAFPTIFTDMRQEPVRKGEK